MRKVLLAGLLVLTACSSPPPQAPPPPPAPAEVVLGQTVVPGTKAPSGHVVPDVVGKNHQQAQDALQAAGFYKLDEEDATGQKRMLVMDRNWVVVEQIPKAGTVLDPKETVKLRSKKYTD
ncbi:PASTA domain-containing protein [Kibdelosporangium aridum]|uniref:PASTA domain-containing protein n=1 Tax=Kibdelosporangium aridum TaxID=2030 RepID=UPI000AC0248C|nr:PASTA domain-containing protein [Kibdelosporangium aridum]